MFFAGRHKWWAWPIGIVAETLWIVYSVTTHQYGFIVASVAYILIYVKNTHAWKRKNSL
jgi:nicotinamide riboside transporter PnuC